MRLGFIRSGIGAATVGVVLAISRPCPAAFGRSGDVSFAADRLMGFYVLDAGTPATYGDRTLLGLGLTPGFGAYTTARLGIDGFVTNHLSIGGSLAFWNLSPRGDGRSASGGLLSPRIGYAINIGDSFGFWPRAGLTYVNYDGDEELGLTLEGQFFASPAAHFAFTFGPALDLGVVGDGREGKSIGVLTFGVLGWI